MKNDVSSTPTTTESRVHWIEREREKEEQRDGVFVQLQLAAFLRFLSFYSTMNKACRDVRHDPYLSMPSHVSDRAHGVPRDSGVIAHNASPSLKTVSVNLTKLNMFDT
jgi:hypothetical protein